jgi:hypothetical protein
MELDMVGKLKERLEGGSVISRGEALQLIREIEELRGKLLVITALRSVGSDEAPGHSVLEVRSAGGAESLGEIIDRFNGGGFGHPPASDPGVADNTFMRTDAAIVQRILDISARDMFGFETMDLVSVLPYEEAKEYLKPSITEAEWQPTARDRKSVIEQMRDYMEFALEKAIDHRGLSANRSINHFQAWLFLLGDDALLQFAEDSGNYKNYGMPILKAICDKYQFAFPATDAAINMASGKQCESGCEEGCG